MEDKQKLRLLRSAVSCASDFEEAKEIVSFILGIETSSPGKPDGCKHDCIKPVLNDGVYIVEDDFLPVHINNVVGIERPKKCKVMVSYHGHEWIVAKEDLKDDKLPLLSKDAHPEDTSSLYKREIEALNDFDMKSCTEHLRKAGIAFELDADLYIPTAGQLATMYLYRKELNKALEMVDGTPMKEDTYWSSSEYDAWVSWLVGFDLGNVINWSNKYYDYYVRPCAAFELKKK
jgi:hypothetical protein